MVAAYTLLISSAVVIVGSFLPWLHRIDRESVSGWDAMDGPVVFGVGIAVLAVGSGAFVGADGVPRWLASLFASAYFTGSPLWMAWAAWAVGSYVAAARVLDIRSSWTRLGLGDVAGGLWMVVVGLIGVFAALMLTLQVRRVDSRAVEP